MVLKGSRIVNLEKSQEYINYLTIHAARCGGEIIITGESEMTIVSTKCSKCNDTIVLEISQKVKGPKRYRRWECNLAAVWGQMSTGAGHSKLQETTGVIGVPVMSTLNVTLVSGGRKN